MTKRAAFWVFLLGTLSSLALFLVLTWDTHRQVHALSNADRLDDRVVAGKRAFEKWNCNDCHTILGFGGYYASDLTRVSRRVGDGGIRYRIRSPEKALADSWRKMPRLGVSDQEIDDLVAFFRWVDGIDNGDWPPQDSRRRLTRTEERLVAAAGLSPGAAVFQARGCMECHALGGTGGSIGPPLDNAGSRMSYDQMVRYVRDPEAANPDTEMPPTEGMSDKEVEEVSRFLAGLK